MRMEPGSGAADPPERFEPPAGGGGGGCLGLLVALVAIALVFLWFAARTEFIRAEAQDRLSRALGTELRVGRTRLTVTGQAIAEAVSAPDAARRLSVGELRFGPGRGMRLEWEAEEVRIDVQSDGGGGWLPATLAALATVEHVGELEERCAGWFGWRAFRVRDARIRFLDVDGVELAALDGVRFEREPLRVRRRTLVFGSLYVREWRRAGQPPLRDVEVEWIAGAGVAPAVLLGDARLPVWDPAWRQGGGATP